MDIIKFHMYSALHLALEDDASAREYEENREYCFLDEKQYDSPSDELMSNEVTRSKRQKRKKTPGKKKSQQEIDDVLDLSGPKLYAGVRSWMKYFIFVGQINIPGLPLLFSLIIRFCIHALAIYVCIYKLLLSFNFVIESYRNPIFVFIGALTVVIFTAHALLTFYVNSFKLGPLFTILTTPRLCFVNERVLHVFGTKSLSSLWIFVIYNAILLRAATYENYTDFVHDLSLPSLLLDIYSVSVTIHLLIGLSHLDYYIRACIGAWFLALKRNIENRFVSLKLCQRELALYRKRVAQIDELRRSSTVMDERLNRSGSMSAENVRATLERTCKFVSLDEVQKSLNNIDDHLEVWRIVQTRSLVLITLNAFLANGTLLLLTYNLLANEGRYYHGTIMFLESASFAFASSIGYVGDSWLSYTLSSFVQTVEDEYFLQGGNIQMDAEDESDKQKLEADICDIGGCYENPNDELDGHTVATLGEVGDEFEQWIEKQRQMLLIKKRDVLFCREFLHQFEHHLATPWTKLTIKTHLSMIGTFITLIAAQIIFDHEH